MHIQPVTSLQGRVMLSGDKSIAHRALMLGALADGVTRIANLPLSDDLAATRRCLESLGVPIERNGGGALYVRGGYLKESAAPLDCGGSGTTIRLIAGLLAGLPFASILAGNAQLARRPMQRVIDPLRQMGADVSALTRPEHSAPGNGRSPVMVIRGGGLRAIDYRTPVASAQIKSCVLLAALHAAGETIVREDAATRDHTERMLHAMGARIEVFENVSSAGPSAGEQQASRLLHPVDDPPRVDAEAARSEAEWMNGGGRFGRAADDYAQGPASGRSRESASPGCSPSAGDWAAGVRLSPSSLSPIDITIPNDFSSAAFFIVAALLVAKSELRIESVNLNPTRTGLLDIVRLMGATVDLNDVHDANGEPVGQLLVRTAGSLQGTTIGGTLVPRAIDEYPLVALLATQAEGETLVRDAAELRVKESDRVAGVVMELRKMGAQLDERPDGFVVRGPTRLKAARVDSHGDHRLAMMLAVAGLIADGETIIDGSEAINKSFPDFEKTLKSLTH
jgi:3-phosphoshikimate 1-carboxyvinyltransferase